MSEWKYGKPPNETVVEVERDGVITKAMAVWGRDGLRPHWVLVSCGTCLSPNAFDRWREAAKAGGAE